jgi:CO/xanthine dehydrogenase Mo-binding subunit
MSGRDPVAFRLVTSGPAPGAVLKRAVEMSGWTPAVVTRRPLAPQMTGTGVGLSRYKNSDAYVAVVAEVSVDTASGAVRVSKIWSATDTGRAVNPDGVLNQIDGGISQAVSWTLQEAGRWDRGT